MIDPPTPGGLPPQTGVSSDSSHRPSVAEPTVYDGVWERKGRSLTAAGFFGMFVIGSAYMIGQVVMVMLGMMSIVLGSVDKGTSGADAAERLLSDMESISEPLRMAVIVSQYLFMLLPVVLLIRWWHTRNVSEYIRLRFDGRMLLEVLLAVLITIAFLPTGSYIVSELSRVVDIPNDYAKIMEGLLRADSTGEFLWLVFVIALTPAICEEVFFRGYVQRTFERSMGWKSILLTGLCFGLFHLQPVGLFTLAIMGMLLGYFFYRSKSLIPPMAAHFTNNFIAVWSLYAAPRFQGVDFAHDESIPFSWVLATAPAGIALLYCYHRLTRSREPRDTPPDPLSSPLTGEPGTRGAGLMSNPM